MHEVLRAINEICFPFRHILCYLLYNFTDRNSHQWCSIIKGVLRNFAKFKGKHLCQSLFFNKVSELQPCNFIKRETLAQVFFPVHIAKFLRTPFYRSTSCGSFCTDVSESRTPKFYYTLSLCSEKAHHSRKNI